MCHPLQGVVLSKGEPSLEGVLSLAGGTVNGDSMKRGAMKGGSIKGV